MKATLILENGIHLSAQIDEQKALELLNEFISRLGNVSSKKLTEDSETKTAKTPQYSTDTKRIAFKCSECGDFAVVKVSNDTAVGDIITCRCGNDMQIKTIKLAFGDCANCGTKFYDIHTANDITELQCRNCKGPIDLIEKPNGTLTGRHNMKY